MDAQTLPFTLLPRSSCLAILFLWARAIAPAAMLNDYDDSQRSLENVVAGCCRDRDTIGTRVVDQGLTSLRGRYSRRRTWRRNCPGRMPDLFCRSALGFEYHPQLS